MKRFYGLLTWVPVLVLAGLLPGCAGLAGLGVEGGVHETSVTPPPPEMAVQMRSWVDKEGKYHEERVMEKLKDPSRPAHLQVMQTTWRDKSGEAQKGTVAALVVDTPPSSEPGVPSRDAWVVVMWRYDGTYSDGCVHGVVVRTDASGEFYAHGWIDPLNFGPQFYPWRRYQRLLVYKPGFAIADTGAGADIRISPSNKKPFIMLHPLTGGLEERLAEVSVLLDGPLNCSTSSLISPPSPQMVPFLLAMLDEATTLVKTKPEQDRVEYMRFQVGRATGLVEPPSARSIYVVPMVERPSEVLSPKAPAMQVAAAPAAVAVPQTATVAGPASRTLKADYCSYLYDISREDCSTKFTERHEDCTRNANAATGIGISREQKRLFTLYMQVLQASDEQFNKRCLAWCNGKDVWYEEFSKAVCNIS